LCTLLRHHHKCFLVFSRKVHLHIRFCSTILHYKKPRQSCKIAVHFSVQNLMCKLTLTAFNIVSGLSHFTCLLMHWTVKLDSENGHLNPSLRSWVTFSWFSMKRLLNFWIIPDYFLSCLFQPNLNATYEIKFSSFFLPWFKSTI
jgi:hypothetical protein